MSPAIQASRRVVLLHGIARSAGCLRKMERCLQSAGFATLNVDYAARKLSIGDIVEGLHAVVAPFAGKGDARLDFVGHSMGGLVARAYINRYRPPNLGRVVLLAPPNQGSEIADLLEDWWPYRKFFGPAGSQLGTRVNGTLGDLLGAIDYPLGIIAGDRSIDPVGWLLIPGPNDGKVSVERTKTDGMTDHVTLHTTHALMMRNDAVIRHSITFLRHGCFQHPHPRGNTDQAVLTRRGS